MIDMRSWPKKWNDVSLRRIVALPEHSSSGAWPLVGMFAIGVVAGAVACYAVTRRSEINRFASRALGMGYEADAFGGTDADEGAPFMSQRSNHRRKATSEVK